MTFTRQGKITGWVITGVVLLVLAIVGIVRVTHAPSKVSYTDMQTAILEQCPSPSAPYDIAASPYKISGDLYNWKGQSVETALQTQLGEGNTYYFTVEVNGGSIAGVTCDPQITGYTP